MGSILMAERSNGDSEPNYLWQNQLTGEPNCPQDTRLQAILTNLLWTIRLFYGNLNLILSQTLSTTWTSMPDTKQENTLLWKMDLFGKKDGCDFCEIQF
jgi:hypothetical protein